MTPDDYVGPEAAARLVIDAMLKRLIGCSGLQEDRPWCGTWVAVREYPMATGMERLTTFCSLMEVPLGGRGKKVGTPLIGVEWQSNKYGTAFQRSSKFAVAHFRSSMSRPASRPASRVDSTLNPPVDVCSLSIDRDSGSLARRLDR